MKKITTLLTLCTVLCGSAFAQDSTLRNTDNTMRDRNQPPCRTGCYFAWGTAFTALTVLGVVVGLTAAQATGNSNNYNNN